MKPILACLIGVTLIHSADAQIFTPESLGGAALGGIAGAIIGNQHHGQSGEGAAIGAGIGYVLGTVAHRHRQYREAAPHPGYTPYSSTYYPYYGSQPSYRGAYYGGSPASYSYSYYPRRRPNYAVGGAVLGGIAGAIIGNQHHGQSGEGAAIGAAAGLVLGGLAERHARHREQEAYVQSTLPRMYAPMTATPTQSGASSSTTAAAQQGVPSKTRPVPVSPMKGANRLFGR